MAISAQPAKRAGTCGACGGTIEEGALFCWRQPYDASRNDNMLHAACASGVVAVRTPAPAIERVWSTYQQALFDQVTLTGSLIVEAVAGSGKTTTIEEFCRRLDPTLRTKYLVFNRRNADEAQRRMPVHVDANTFHGSCSAPLRQYFPNARLDKDKMRKIFRHLCEIREISKGEADAYAGAIMRLVNLAKAEGVAAFRSTHTADEWHEIIDHYGIEFDRADKRRDDDELVSDATDRCVEIAMKMLDISNSITDSYDFDDMLYFIVQHNIPMQRFDVICVDESQDTNRIQRALLHMMLLPGGRLIAIGDPKQSIYGFRGATSNAMDLLRDEFGCSTLPLSVNYRCSKAVIRAAQEWCPALQAWDQAIEGSVQDLGAYRLSDFRESDAVLCRVTAPLIQLAYKFIGAHIPVHVLGRDIGEGMVKLVERMKADDIDELSVALDAYLARELARFAKKGEDDKAQSVEDRVESLRAVIDNLPEDKRTIAGLIEDINSLFSATTGVTLSTVHKAKGLEWTRVFILDRNKMPSKWARQEWAKVQEENIIYVAYTRAKEDLIFVDSNAIH